MDAEAVKVEGERAQFATASGGIGDLVPHAPALAVPFPKRQHARGWIAAGLQDVIEREKAHGTGFVLVPVMLGTGALAYYGLDHEPGWQVIVSVLLTALIAAVLLPTGRVPRMVAAALALICAGMVLAKFEVWRLDTVMNGSAVTTRVTGTIVSIEHQASGRIRLTLDVIATERPSLRYAPGRIRASARTVPMELRPGDVVNGVVRMFPASGPVRPGGYDFAFMNYFSGIGASGFFMGDPQRVEEAPQRALAARIEALRLALAERVRSHIAGPEGEIAATLTAGMRSAIPEDAAEALRRTGLAHILAISGLHMGLVAGTVMIGLRTAFALFPGFSSRYPTKKYAAFLALLACAFYLLLSGGAVAAQRSFIMLAVMLAALLFDRAALTLRNLAIAATIVIVTSPHEVVGPSFQMSFAATAVLIGAYAIWSRRREGQDHQATQQRGLGSRFLRMCMLFVVGLAATSLLAGLATTLYGVHHFHRVSPHALQVNLLAMPLVTLLVMPAAVIGVLLMPLGLEGVAFQVMGWGVAQVLAIATWFSDRSPIDAVGAIPPSAVLVLTIALIAMTLFATTAMRLLAVPLALTGLMMLFARDLPDVLVSEDGRLVAVHDAQGALAVNRTRPNAFTIQNWLMAQGASRMHAPTAEAEPLGHFSCAEGTCRLMRSAATIVHVEKAVDALRYCTSASVIVIEDPVAGNPCRTGRAAVLPARTLALEGSAMLWLDPASGWVRKIEHSIAQPLRPWHSHRAFSRAARGLPE
jgi:ComEC/Rec2-related protein